MEVVIIIKKSFIILLFILVGLACLSGCGNTDEPTDSNPPQPEPEVATKEVVLYFSDNNLMFSYRVKTDVIVKEGEQVEKAALEAWILGPDNTELSGLINKNVKVQSIDIVDGTANVSFSKEIMEANLGSTGEGMMAEQIAMIMEQFGYARTQILVEGKVVGTLLGHLDTTQPIIAGDPESFLWIEDKGSEDVVLENAAFQVYEPAPYSEIQKDSIVVRGLARVYEGTILYEFEDGHYVLDEGMVMASEGAPGWGEFEIIIKLDEIFGTSGTIILFEKSAKDGSRINELPIPINVIN